MPLREKQFHVTPSLVSGLAAFLLPLIVYVLTLAPTVFNLDSAELTTAAATDGLTRATGYPLYLSIGWLWSKLPIGDVGYRMNLLSAVSAALTLLLCERILLRLGVRKVARLSAVGLLAFSKYFWQLSLIAEVYTLQTAISAGLILALMAWSEKPTSVRLGLVGLLIGLGLSHHMATVLLLPGVVFYVLAVNARLAFRWKSAAVSLAGIALGLAFYVYLPLRYQAKPAFNYAGTYDAAGVFHPDNLASIEGLWNIVTGATFASSMFRYSIAGVWQELARFFGLLAGSFLAIGIGPGLLGAWQSIRSNWKLGAMLGLMFVGHTLFYINYDVIDKELMYLPAYLIWAIWVGYGYELILSWNDRAPLTRSIPINRKQVNLSNLVLSGVMVAMVIAGLALNWRLVDLSRDWSARERGEEILEILPADSVFFGYWDSVPVIQYLQLVEGKRPDVLAVNRFLVSQENMATWIRRDLESAAIFIDNLPPQLLKDVGTVQEGSIYRLTPLTVPRFR